jgi:dienelactone hydrolase
MTRNLSAAGLAALLVSCCLGCAQDDQARMLLAPTPVWSDQDVMGLPGVPAEVVLRNAGRIDSFSKIEVADKAQIDVWVIKARDAAGKPAPATGTVLVLHAYTSGKGSYPYLGVAERLARKGYDVVLPDLRCHGHSTGDAITFGVKEKDDLKRVMDRFIADKTVHGKVYVFGAGLGACVGIQYAAIDPRVAGVVAIAPYKDFRSFARQRHPLMEESKFQGLLVSAGRLGNFKPDEASTVVGASKLTCPLLVIHGILDFTVPQEWSQAVYDAATGPRKLQVVSMDTPLVAALYEDWITGQVDALARNGLKEPSAESRPAATTRPAAGM